MGTSSSSSGPGAGVSFDPPWLDIIAVDFLPPQKSNEEEEDSEQIGASIDTAEPSELAPSRRFGTARRYLGEYITNGNKDSLRKALGSYSSKGMGGAKNVARRMRASTAVGARLFNLLQEIRENSNEKIQDWVRQLTEKTMSVQELADEIIDKIISIGGSLDEESCKDSMAKAMSEFLSIYPDADLMNMNDNNIWFVIEQFISNEAFNRLILDIGQRIESTKYAFSRMIEMNDYLRAEISAQIQELRDSNQNSSTKELDNLLQSAIKITYEIFEEAI